MKSLRRFFARLAGLATRRAQDERSREEIEEHIALQTAENIRAGLSPVEARRQAMLKFGGVEAIKEDYRVERGLQLRRVAPDDGQGTRAGRDWNRYWAGDGFCRRAAHEFHGLRFWQR